MNLAALGTLGLIGAGLYGSYSGNSNNGYTKGFSTDNLLKSLGKVNKVIGTKNNGLVSLGTGLGSALLQTSAAQKAADQQYRLGQQYYALANRQYNDQLAAIRDEEQKKKEEEQAMSNAFNNMRWNNVQ